MGLRLLGGVFDAKNAVKYSRNCVIDPMTVLRWGIIVGAWGD